MLELGVSPESERPSIVSMRLPSAYTASIKHPLHDFAVDAHGARAAYAVLAADVRAGRPKLFAQKSIRCCRADAPRHCRTVDGQRRFDCVLTLSRSSSGVEPAVARRDHAREVHLGRGRRIGVAVRIEIGCERLRGDSITAADGRLPSSAAIAVCASTGISGRRRDRRAVRRTACRRCFAPSRRRRRSHNRRGGA